MACELANQGGGEGWEPVIGEQGCLWQSFGMSDWKVVDLPSVFQRVVRSYDLNGREVSDDGEWHRVVSEMNYVLAEFLSAKPLIAEDVDVSRHSDLVIWHSQLTEHGKAFDKSLAIDRWMQSFDRRKPGSPVTADGLERRWRKFTNQRMQ